MDMNPELRRYSFHATWELDKKLAKPFHILMAQVNQHIDDETHDTFLEEGLLFKSYLYMSGIGGNSNNRSTEEAKKCLTVAITRLNKRVQSTEKDGFLSVAYALQAWIDIDKTESRLGDLKQLHANIKFASQTHFEATLHYIKGYSLSRLGTNRYPESIAEFRLAYDKYPEHREYLFSLALITRRLYGSDANDELETMLNKVLEKQKDYLYAKVELASIKCWNENETEATELLKQVTKALENKKYITPENMKVLGHVMNIYRLMGKYDDAEETYHMACGFNVRPVHSLVVHQRAMLAKKRGQWNEYERILETVLERDSFNITAKLMLVKQQIHRAQITDIKAIDHEFEIILSAHEGDEIAKVKILTDHGILLLSKNAEGRAVVRYSNAMDTAFNFCQRKSDANLHRVKFYNEINSPVGICVTNIRKYYKSNIQDPERMCKLIKLEYQLRNLYLTRSYCKDALQMALGESKRIEMECILAETEIELSVNSNSLTEVEERIERIKPQEEYKEKLDALLGQLALKRGMLHDSLACADDAHTEYSKAAKLGNIRAITILLSALDTIDRNCFKFYQICATIDISIETVQLNDERIRLRQRLDDVLETAISGDLKRLRKQQFRMEKSLLIETGRPKCEAAAADVIHLFCKLLNYAMVTLAKGYRPKSKDPGHTLDFFCILQNFDKTQTEGNVKAKLQRDKWNNVDKELVTFLVEVQPSTNPRANNWIMAIMDFDNTDKHQRENDQYGIYKVYPEEPGAPPGVYQDKEYGTVDLARTVCDNVAYMLNNLNGFSSQF